MNESIRGWVEAIANLGVLVGLLFLVYEVNQTNVNQRMEAKLSLSERFAELDGGVAETRDLAQILVKADVLGAELTQVELLRYQSHYHRWLNILMRVDALYEEGVLDDSDWRKYVCEVRLQATRSRAFRRFVDRAREEYLTPRVYKAITEPAACAPNQANSPRFPTVPATHRAAAKPKSGVVDSQRAQQSMMPCAQCLVSLVRESRKRTPSRIVLRRQRIT